MRSTQGMFDGLLYGDVFERECSKGDDYELPVAEIGPNNPVWIPDSWSRQLALGKSNGTILRLLPVCSRRDVVWVYFDNCGGRRSGNRNSANEKRICKTGTGELKNYWTRLHQHSFT